MIRKQSVLTKRVFVVMLSAMLMVAVLTGVMFSVLSGQTFTQLTRQELVPKASALAGLISRYEKGELTADVLSAMVNDTDSGESVLGAYAHAIRPDGTVVLTSSLFQNSTDSEFNTFLSRGIAGTESVGILRINGTQMYSVCEPIPNNGGAVLLCMPMTQQLAAHHVFRYALVVALLVSVPLAILAAWLATGKVLQPLTQITKVALEMANGHLKVRADENAIGEIGDVSRSLNKMARQLSDTIYRTIVERDRMEHIIDGLSEGIVSLDASGRIMQYNPSIAKLFPIRDPLELDDRLRLIPDARIWRLFDTALQKLEPVVNNLEMEGGIVIRLMVTPIFDEMNECAGVVGLFSDVTEMERLERTRREYVANVSHEMRTPLTALQGLVEPLKEGMVRTEEDRQRYYGIILRETKRLNRLISDLMELSRLQSGSLAIKKRRFNLKELVEDVCDNYSGIAENQGQTFRLETDLTGCPEVFSNEDRVEQLMVILLDNAIKYTGEGGTVSVGASWNQDKVTLFVKDTGIGISREDLPYVFDRFYKVDRAHSGKGSGLGLSIARELLHWMGEDIWVHSVQGEGSTFFFTVSVWKETDMPQNE